MRLRLAPLLLLFLLAGCGAPPGTPGATSARSASPLAGSVAPVTPSPSSAAPSATARPAATSALLPGSMGLAASSSVASALSSTASAPRRVRLVDALDGSAVPCAGARVDGVTLQTLAAGDCRLPPALPAARLSATGYEPAALPAQDGADVRLVPAPETVARAYLTALQAQQWGQLWQLSHPLAQERWPSEQAFAAFVSARFAPGGQATIASSTVGRSESVPAWGDLRFTRQPVAAARLTAQLKLVAGAPYANLPANLLLERPMMLVRDGAVWKVADAGPADLQGPVLVPSHAAERQLRVPILMYHHVAPPPQRTPQMGDYDYRLAVDLTVAPDRFAAQLEWLLAHHFTTITPQQLLAALYDGVALPAHPILLTFDDGYLDNYQVAWPALEQRGMIGAFNIITGLMGRQQGGLDYLSWEQAAAMATAGMPIESHTVWHRDLGTLSEQDAWGELVGSRDAIAEHLGEAPQVICYPSGEPFRHGNVAAEQRILRLAAKAGYAGGLLDMTYSSALQSSATPLQLPRIRVAGEETLNQFATSIQQQAGGT